VEKKRHTDKQKAKPYHRDCRWRGYKVREKAVVACAFRSLTLLVVFRKIFLGDWAMSHNP